MGSYILFAETDLVKVLEDLSCPPASTQPVLLISRAIGGNSEHSCPQRLLEERSGISSCSTKDMEVLSRSFAEVQHAIRDLRRSVETQASMPAIDQTT